MQSCIAAGTRALNASLRRVLDGFHCQKAHGAVDAMLLRLYEPILFRGLSATNSAVRCNSLCLLFDAFPLQVLPPPSSVGDVCCFDSAPCFCGCSPAFSALFDALALCE